MTKFIPQALEILSRFQQSCPHLVSLVSSGDYLVADQEGEQLCVIKAEAVDAERVLFTVYQEMDLPDNMIFETEVEEEVMEYLGNPDNKLD